MDSSIWLLGTRNRPVGVCLLYTEASVVLAISPTPSPPPSLSLLSSKAGGSDAFASWSVLFRAIASGQQQMRAAHCSIHVSHMPDTSMRSWLSAAGFYMPCKRHKELCVVQNLTSKSRSHAAILFLFSKLHCRKLKSYKEYLSNFYSKYLITFDMKHTHNV